MLTATVLIALAIAGAFIAQRSGERLETAAATRVASRKHVRIAYDHGRNAYRFTYYGANGRKVTQRRNIAVADVARLKVAAVARGYSVISF